MMVMIKGRVEGKGQKITREKGRVKRRKVKAISEGRGEEMSEKHLSIGRRDQEEQNLCSLPTQDIYCGGPWKYDL